MDNYPMRKVIQRSLANLGISKKQLVLRQGYRNVVKGLRRLDEYISGARLPGPNAHRLAAALEISEQDMKNLVRESARYLKLKQQRYERERFQPHLMAQCERRIPRPIFLGCMVDHWRFITLDADFVSLPYIEQLTLVGTAIREHMLKRTEGIPAFGKIRYYVLRRDYDEPVEDIEVFATDGSLIAERTPDMRVDSPTNKGLRVKGRSIDGLLRIE